MDWNPSPEVRHWVDAARYVLDEYGSYGPMTVRQIFYRLVGSYGYKKDERAYKRLAEYLVKARRAQMIQFGGSGTTGRSPTRATASSPAGTRGIGSWTRSATQATTSA
jgi:hypothetical protein